MLLQLFTIFGFGAIALQDIKERMVSWLFFPLVALFLGFAHWQKSTLEIFLLVSLTNVLFVTVIILISWIYTKCIGKKRYLNQSIGLGDILFFYAIAFGFPTMTFVVLYISALVFSLLLHGVLHFISKSQATVPLAGYMSLFMIAVLVFSHILGANQLYMY